MVAAGTARGPEMFLFLSASFGVTGGQDIEAAARDAQLMGGFGGAEGVLVEGFENMADERLAVTMEQLLVLFITEINTSTPPQRPSFSSAFATLRLTKKMAVGAISLTLLHKHVLL